MFFFIPPLMYLDDWQKQRKREKEERQRERERQRAEAWAVSPVLYLGWLVLVWAAGAAAVFAVVWAVWVGD